LNDVAPAVFDLPEIVRLDNAAEVRLAGEQFLDRASGAVRMDLGALRESNSILVAVLLAWVRHAAKLGRTLRYDGVPAELRQIIELYGVANLLPIEAAGANGSLPPTGRDAPGAAAAATAPGPT
jgi:phospholipid transport system transporter-binding protein